LWASVNLARWLSPCLQATTRVADVSVIIRSQTAQARQSASQIVASFADTTFPSSVADQSTSVDRDDLSPLFDEAAAQPLLSINSVDRTELIRLQQADPDLKNLFDLVDQEEHQYSYRFRVLMRAWRDKLSPQEATYHQVVVPSVLRAKLLSVTHNIPAAGHLGVAKMKDRLLRHFYWPTISKDVKEFCRSCDICQRLGKGASSPPALDATVNMAQRWCNCPMDPERNSPTTGRHSPSDKLILHFIHINSSFLKHVFFVW